MKTGQNFTASIFRNYQLVFSLENSLGDPVNAEYLVASFLLTDSAGGTVTKSTAAGTITANGATLTVPLSITDIVSRVGACSYSLTVAGEVVATGTGTVTDALLTWVVSRNGSVPPEMAEEIRGTTSLYLEASLSVAELNWWEAGGHISTARLVAVYDFLLTASKAAGLLDLSGNTRDLIEVGTVPWSLLNGLGVFSDANYLRGAYNWSTNYSYAFRFAGAYGGVSYPAVINSSGDAVNGLLYVYDGKHYLINNNKSWSLVRGASGLVVLTPNTCWFDKNKLSGPAVGYGTYTGANWRVGRRYSGTGWAYGGYLHRLAIFSDELTDTESEALTVAMDGVNLYAAEGDSISSGYLITTSWPFTAYSNLRISKQLAPLVNFATASATFATINARAALLDTYLKSHRTTQVLSVMIGTNDLSSTDVTTVYASLVAYCQARQTAGFKVVVVNCIPRNESAIWKTRRATYNALIAANWSTFADAFADTTTSTAFDNEADYSDLTYYQADGIHPNQTGADELASIIQPVVESLL